MYADYTYYLNTYKGTMSAEDFNRLGVHASAVIDDITNGRASTQAETEAVKNAMCAVADELLTQEQGGEIVSESNDGISRSYASGTSRSRQQRLYGAARVYLANTGLLFVGV